MEWVIWELLVSDLAGVDIIFSCCRILAARRVSLIPYLLSRIRISYGSITRDECRSAEQSFRGPRTESERSQAQVFYAQPHKLLDHFEPLGTLRTDLVVLAYGW